MPRIGTKLEDTIDQLSKSYPLAFMDKDPEPDASYNEIYLNPAQKLMYNFKARVLYCKAGRGLGKSTWIAMRVAEIIQSIPLGTTAFMGASVKQIMCRTLPAIVKSLELVLHWKEGVQFFRGRAPRSARVGDLFPDPLTKPRIWENVIHFYDGSVLYLASTAITGTVNSLNLVAVLGDEVKYFPWKKVLEEVKPALRGDSYDHPGWRRTNPLYLSETWVSDAGLTAKSREWEKAKEDQTPEVNDQICDMIAIMERAQETDANHGTNYTQRLLESRDFVRVLQHLRCQSRVFMQFSSLENLALLHPEYIREQQRSLPPLMYNCQILGQDNLLDKSELFYKNFDIDLHGYFPNFFDELNKVNSSSFIEKSTTQIDLGAYTKRIDYEAPSLERLSNVNDCSLDVDCNFDDPLYLTHDANKGINTLCVGQLRRIDGIDCGLFLKSMYVAKDRFIEDLMEDFCHYYAPKKRLGQGMYANFIIIAFDSTSRQGGAYASKDADMYRFFNIMKRILQNHGWLVHLIDMGSPMLHHVKYEFINACLAGKTKVFPKVNRLQNDYLLASLENSKVCYGKLGIAKDKSVEKAKKSVLDENNEDTNTYTDMSDAFDNMLRCWNFFVKGNLSFGSTSVSAWLPEIH